MVKGEILLQHFRICRDFQNGQRAKLEPSPAFLLSKSCIFPPYLLPQVFKVCEHERLSRSDAHMSENRDSVSRAL